MYIIEKLNITNDDYIQIRKKRNFFLLKYETLRIFDNLVTLSCIKGDDGRVDYRETSKAVAARWNASFIQ